MATKASEADAIFSEGLNCAQAVLAPFARESGMDGDTAMRVAAAFGGGIARTAATCGAVTGGLMALGLKYGAIKGSDTEAKEHTYKVGREFMRAFEERMGSVVCKTLVGYDISIPQERKKAGDAGQFKTVCPRAIAVAVELVEAMR